MSKELLVGESMTLNDAGKQHVNSPSGIIVLNVYVLM